MLPELEAALSEFFEARATGTLEGESVCIYIVIVAGKKEDTASCWVVLT